MSYADYRDFREKTPIFRVLIAYDEMMLALSGNNQAPPEFRLAYQGPEAKGPATAAPGGPDGGYGVSP